MNKKIKIALASLAVAFLMLFIRIHRIEDGIHIETRYYSIAVKSDGF